MKKLLVVLTAVLMAVTMLSGIDAKNKPKKEKSCVQKCQNENENCKGKASKDKKKSKRTKKMNACKSDFEACKKDCKKSKK